MLRPIDQYFLQHEEPVKSCLQFLRSHLLSLHADITEEWKYKMPFYCYNGKMILYLWTHKKYRQPYIGIVDGAKIDDPVLIKEKRARMKILLIDPDQDLPMEQINSILRRVVAAAVADENRA